MRAARSVKRDPSNMARWAMLESGFNLGQGGSGQGDGDSAPYDARSDPHLTKFWRARKSALHDDPASEAFLSGPVSTEHVLALKRLFTSFSAEIYGNACKRAACTAAEAGVRREHMRVVQVANSDLLRVIQFGISVTNHHRRLSHHTLLPQSVGPDDLEGWLQILGCELTVDWPSFLLLCSADLLRDRAMAERLANAHERYLQSNPPVSTEEAYHDLLAFLLYSVRPANVRPPPSFFQSGDCYRARHACNFAETIFSLLPHRVQFYLQKANARGMSLATNHCGHAPAASVLPPRLNTPGTIPGRSTLLPLDKPSTNPKAIATKCRAASARRQHRAFL
jgi:hypothetical protein